MRAASDDDTMLDAERKASPFCAGRAIVVNEPEESAGPTPPSLRPRAALCFRADRRAGSPIRVGVGCACAVVKIARSKALAAFRALTPASRAADRFILRPERAPDTRQSSARLSRLPELCTHGSSFR